MKVNKLIEKIKVKDLKELLNVSSFLKVKDLKELLSEIPDDFDVIFNSEHCGLVYCDPKVDVDKPDKSVLIKAAYRI